MKMNMLETSDKGIRKEKQYKINFKKIKVINKLYINNI